jgi:hypothetical protein
MSSYAPSWNVTNAIKNIPAYQNAPAQPQYQGPIFRNKGIYWGKPGSDLEEAKLNNAFRGMSLNNSGGKMRKSRRVRKSRRMRKSRRVRKSRRM